MNINNLSNGSTKQERPDLVNIFGSIATGLLAPTCTELAGRFSEEAEICSLLGKFVDGQSIHLTSSQAALLWHMIDNSTDRLISGCMSVTDQESIEDMLTNLAFDGADPIEWVRILSEALNADKPIIVSCM
jgi:hypothetical protein